MAVPGPAADITAKLKLAVEEAAVAIAFGAIAARENMHGHTGHGVGLFSNELAYAAEDAVRDNAAVATKAAAVVTAMDARYNIIGG